MKKQYVTAAPPQEPASQATPPALTEPRKGFLRSWSDFWFRPSDPVSLHLVRFFSGLLFFFWLVSLAGHQFELFSRSGWFDSQAYKETRNQQDQPIPDVTANWSLLWTLGSNPMRFNAFYGVSLGVFLLFALGVATRLTAPLTWVILGSFLFSPATLYEADFLLVVLGFYLMLGYVLLGLWNGQRSWTTWLYGPSDALIWKTTGRLASGAEPPAYSCSANLALRLLQVHFVIIIVASALHKLQFGDWWGGVAFFYPLHSPLETTQEQIKAEMANATTWLFCLSLGQYLLLAWQLAFPVFAWRRGWRPVLLGGAVIGWIGSIYLYKLPLFGPIYLIACLSFVTPEEWHQVGKVLGFIARLFRGRKSETQEEKPLPAKLQPQRA
jgi:hypothetical protein